MFIEDLDNSIHKTISFMGKEYENIRTGNINPNMFDNVEITHNSAKLTIKSVGNSKLIDKSTVVINIWAKEMIGDVVKAIKNHDSGLNPMPEGNGVLIRMPSLSSERREELTKLASKIAESTKIKIRNIRQDAIQSLKKQLTNKEISEDDKKKTEKQIQESIDQANKEIDKLCSAKKNAILV